MQNNRKMRKRFDIVNFMPYILGIIALAVIAAIVAAVFSSKDRKVNNSALIKLPGGANENFVAFNGGIAYIDASSGNLYFVDDRGETMWGFSGASEGMKMYPGKTRLGVSLGKKLQVLNSAGTLAFSKEFERNISFVAMGEKLIAVNLSDSDDTVILNSTGEIIDSISSATGSTNIKFGVFGEGNSVWVISVENSGYVPKYMLSTYKYDTEKKQTVTFEVDDQMIYNAVFAGNVCYILGTEKIMLRDCDYTGSVNTDYTVNGYDVISYNLIGKKLNLLLLNNGYLKGINETGITDFPCQESLITAFVSKKNYYGFSSYFMYKINPKNKKCTAYRFPIKIEEVVHGDGYAVIKSDNVMYLYNIPD